MEMKNSVDIFKYVNSDEYNDFGRTSIANDFVSVVTSTKFSHVCLNGAWGSGKTTFIHDVMKRIESDKEAKNLVVYFDAWKYENYEDPMLAIISCINIVNPNLIGKTFEKNMTKFKPSITAGFLSFDVEKKTILGDEYIDRYLKKLYYQEKSMFVFNKVLDEHKGVGKGKLIVFVDELDRCRPEFAMSVFEKLHHTDPREDIVFIYSSDLKQLESMVEQHYGSSYSSEIFFHKIFDTVFTLSKLNKNQLQKYYNSKFENTNHWDCKITWKLIEMKNPTLRMINVISRELNEFRNGKFYNNLMDGDVEKSNGIKYSYRLHYANIFYCLLVLKNTDSINIINLSKNDSIDLIVDDLLVALEDILGFIQFLADVSNDNKGQYEPTTTIEEVEEYPKNYLKHCLDVLSKHHSGNLSEIFNL